MSFARFASDAFRSLDSDCCLSADVDLFAEMAGGKFCGDSEGHMLSMIETSVTAQVEMLSKKIGITVEAVTARAKFPLEQGE